MNKDAKKILKTFRNSKCPECGAKGLNLVAHNKINDGVVYTEKNLECNVCEYSEVYKEKHTKLEFED